MTSAPDAPIVCPSCGHTLEVRYCTHCGEERLDPHKLTAWYFLTQSLVPELLNVDGKIWRTLRFLLFRPGFLAREYAEGRRRPYIGPFRIFLVAFLVYVLSSQGLSFTLDIGGIKFSVVPASRPVELDLGDGGTVSQIDRLGIIERILTEKMGSLGSVSTEDVRRYNGMLNSVGTALSATVVLLMSLVLYACFHRRRPLLVEHGVFSLHYLSFVLLSSLVSVVVVRAGLFPNVGVLLLLLNLVNLWHIGYFLAAIRRFYLSDKKPLAAWGIAIAVGIPGYLLCAAFITVLQLLAGIVAALWL